MSNSKMPIWDVIVISLMFGFMVHGFVMAILIVMQVIEKELPLGILMIPASIILLPACVVAIWICYKIKQYQLEDQNESKD